MNKPVILCIDDEASTLTLLQYLLKTGNYTAITADKGSLGIELARERKPDVILLDVEMPEMNGYDVCLQLQKNPITAYIPVVFLSSNTGDQDRKKAFAAGAADFMTKPFSLDHLLQTIQCQLERNAQWQQLKKMPQDAAPQAPAPQAAAPQSVASQSNRFQEFKKFAALKLQFPPERNARWSQLSVLQLYEKSSDFGISHDEMARLIAGFMKAPYIPHIQSQIIRIGVIPASFSKLNNIIAVDETVCGVNFMLSNPFDMVLLDTMKKFIGVNQTTLYAVTKPDTLAGLFDKSNSIHVPASETEAKAHVLRELGMNDMQTTDMIALAKRDTGLILIVGPTGSGKTTTIYSLLDCIDCRTKSLLTVEDPIEYKIPFANQQQVNEKDGSTFKALLKSSVSQNPDILFLGELRDALSAKLFMDFAGAGYLAISTIHSSNATTTISHLERLGITRSTMAGSIIGIVAQRLLKKLCNHCKIVTPVTSEERKILSTRTDDIPAKTAHPGGCEKCDNTGYLGREGVYELLRFDKKVAEMICEGVAIADIRKFIRIRGDYLISDHALDKVRQLKFSINDVNENILLDEPSADATPAKSSQVASPVFSTVSETTHQKQSVLIVDDDPTSRTLIEHFLTNNGYEVTSAGDGIDALLLLGQRPFDLIISDIDMPNLDGFKLLEMLNQKGLHIPVIMVSGSTGTDDEIKGLKLGAADYMRKPINKDALLIRTRKVLDAQHHHSGDQ